MKFPSIKAYIEEFEKLAGQAGYTSKKFQTVVQFVKGLPVIVKKQIGQLPYQTTYWELKQKAINATRSHIVTMELVKALRQMSNAPKKTSIASTQRSPMATPKDKPTETAKCPSTDTDAYQEMLALDQILWKGIQQLAEEERNCQKLPKFRTLQENLQPNGQANEELCQALARTAALRQADATRVYISAWKSMMVRVAVHSIAK